MATSKPLKSYSKAELEEEMIVRNLQVSNLTKQQMMDAIVQYDTDSNTEMNKRLEMESGMKTPESQIGRMNTEKKDKRAVLKRVKICLEMMKHECWN
jgi:hypothetical protein